MISTFSSKTEVKLRAEIKFDVTKIYNRKMRGMQIYEVEEKRAHVQEYGKRGTDIQHCYTHRCGRTE